MRAFPGCRMVRCESDWIVKVSVVMKTEEVFIVIF